MKKTNMATEMNELKIKNEDVNNKWLRLNEDYEELLKRLGRGKSGASSST